MCQKSHIFCTKLRKSCDDKTVLADALFAIAANADEPFPHPKSRANLWVMVATSQRYSNTQRFLLAALWFELLILTVKVLVGWQSNSLALLATALYCAIAAVSAIYAIVATQRLQRCGRIVWGHRRWETGTAFLLVGILGFGCISLASIALQNLAAAPQLSQVPPITITTGQIQGLLLFGLASLGLAILQKRAAIQCRILALAQNADRVLYEAIGSFITLLALMLVQQGYTWLDSILTLGLSIGAGFSAWQMLLQQVPLMVQQVAIAPESIAQVVRQVDGVTNCYNIESRGIVGRQVLISLRLVVHPEFLGMEGRIMQSVEALLRETYGPITVNVHIDSDWNGLQEALIDAASANNSPHSGIDRA
jgi:cation diffusion facilitator family transporter